MEIILQKDLKHQQEPVERVCKVFENVSRIKTPYFSNPLFYLNDSTIQDNIKQIQKDISVTNRTKEKNENVLNLDIKMETGTGKTYVYAKTIYELHKQYGINKFIVIVPSLPIKAGAKSFFSDSYVLKHFRDICGYKSDIDLQVLTAIKSSSKKQNRNYFPGTIREFASGSSEISNRIHVLLLNMQLLSGTSKILSDYYDNSVNGYYQPYEALQSTHPFVIIDEPHKFSRNQTAYKKIITNIKPQCIIRYGATFPDITIKDGKTKIKQKDYLNLLYDLNSYEAFNRNLIKGVAKEHFGTPNNLDEKVKISSINNKKTANFIYTKKDYPNKTFTLGKNDSLSIISSNFGNLTITALGNDFVEFSNGQTKKLNEPFEASIYMPSYIEGMLKLALERHFKIERENFNRRIKIKTLALFFIDDINSFRGNEPYLKVCFEKLLKEKIETELKTINPYEYEYEEYLKESLKNIEKCSGAYFARDNNDSDEAIAEEVQEILFDKKKLLSIKDNNGNYNTKRFIFSKWTLKEGWDNPNIFTICKLRSSGSDITKLQEVGRGLRLPVDEIGNRVSNEDFLLNYIVDFTEEHFAEDLIREINGDLPTLTTISTEQINDIASKLNITPNELFCSMLSKNYIDFNRNIIESNRENFYNEYPLFFVGVRKDKVIDRNKKQVNTIKIRSAVFDELKSLWLQINQKYLLMYENDIDNTLQNDINNLITDDLFDEVTIRSERSIIVSNDGKMFLKTEAGYESNINSKIPYNEFLIKISNSTSLPIKMIHNAFYNYSNNIDDKFFNSKTMSNFITRFNDWKIMNLQERFKYSRANTTITGTALTNADGTIKSEIVQGNVGTKIIPNASVSPKYLYDTYTYDSELEKENLLVDIEEIVVYGKIPRKSLEIPVIDGGTYSPDFMYVVKDKSGNKTLNIIIETKDVEGKIQLRDNERIRIENARKFFESLEIDGYNVKFKDQLNNKSILNIINDVLR